MISFQLTEYQEKIKAEAEEFGRTIIAPRAEEIERTDEAPMDIWAAMARAPYKYTGMHIPQEYGGFPRPLVDQVIIIEEVTAWGKSPVSTILLDADNRPGNDNSD